MRIIRLAAGALAFALVLFACAPTSPAVTDAPPNLGAADSETGGPAEAGAAHVDTLDLTQLTLGDGRASSSPQRGYVFSCVTQFNGGGAQGAAWWLNGDGTWDLTKKAVVDGAVSWPHELVTTIEGGTRTLAGNGLPNHTTGVYPISPGDDAYQVDRNPNSIAAQALSLAVPANPVPLPAPNCMGGELGVSLSGSPIFSAFDAQGRDAPAHEVQDECGGHPQRTGVYHYHALSDCPGDTTAGHSALMGYALDGFGIYGYYGEDGKEMTNANLDECHGHTHTIEWDGETVEMFHYHATREFPYTVGCFRGETAARALSAGGAQQGDDQQTQSGQPGKPPPEAIAACANLEINSGCSLTTQSGVVSGTCLTPPQTSQLACVPVGGPPEP